MLRRNQTYEKFTKELRCLTDARWIRCPHGLANFSD